MRAISSTVGTILALAILVTVFLPFAVNYYFSITRSASSQSAFLYMLREKVYTPLSIVYNKLDGTLELRNTGGRFISITGVVFRNTTDGSLVYYRVLALTISDGSNYFVGNSTGAVVLETGGSVVLDVPAGLEPLYVVTRDGVVLSVRETGSTVQYSQLASALQVQSVTFFTGNLLSQVQSGQISINPALLTPPTPTAVANGLTAGMFRVDNYGNKYPLVMYYEGDNVTVDIEMAVAGNVFIGYDPNWEREAGGVGPNPEYAILITGVFALYDTSLAQKGIPEAVFRIGGYSWTSTDTSRYGGIVWSWNGTVTYDSVAGKMEYGLEGQLLHGWRLKIMGLKPEEIAIKTIKYNRLTGTYSYEWLSGNATLGKWYYGGFEGIPLHVLIIRGVASLVRFYAVDTALEGYPSSYEPYLFIADTDGNGYPEINYITEDMGYGHVGTYNDMADYYMDEVSYLSNAYYSMPDYATESFKMVFTSIPISGSQYSVVTVDVRLYFHDNLGDDINEVQYSDRALIGVVLIDPATGQVVSGTEYSYQQLASWEDTWPPNENFVTLSVPLLVPNTNDTYYVAFEFYDPYSYLSGGYDDGDFTMGLEFIGITYYSR